MVRSLENEDADDFERNEYMMWDSKMWLYFRMQKKSQMEAYNKGGYPQNHSNLLSEFRSIDHAPHYSSSSRGGMGMDQTTYSVGPHHAKVPSNNSG